MVATVGMATAAGWESRQIGYVCTGTETGQPRYGDDCRGGWNIDEDDRHNRDSALGEHALAVEMRRGATLGASL
jgi:hypothetical protein